MLSYRLVDKWGWEWPDLASSPEDLEGDKKYMEAKHPNGDWKIQVRDVSDWRDVEGLI